MSFVPITALPRPYNDESMFDLFRSQDTAVKFVLGGILVLVAVSMVVTLVPGTLAPAAATADGATLVEIGDRSITIEQVEARRRALQYAQIPADSLAPIMQNAIEDMITNEALMNEAERLGIAPNDEELARHIVDQLSSSPMFPDGKFDPRTYELYIRQQFQISVPRFESELRRDLAVENRLRQLVTNKVVIADDELRELYRKANEQTKVEYVTVLDADFRAQLRPTEEELQTRFENFKVNYRVSEKRAISILEINALQLPEPEVSDADMRAFYDRNPELFTVSERVKARHILFANQDKTDEEKVEIEKKANEVLARVKGGESLSELAAEFSDDPGNKEQGGDLGWVTRGAMVPAFEEALFKLKPGETSNLVETDFGLHIILAEDRENRHLRPFEEVESQIRLDLLTERRQLAQSQAVTDALELARQPDANLQEIAQRFNGSVSELAPFAKAGPPPVLTALPQLINTIFTLPEGEVSSGVDGEITKVTKVTSIEPARDATLDEVRVRVLNDVLSEQARTNARERGDQIATAAKESGDLAAVARRNGLSTKTTEFVLPGGTIPELGPASTLGAEAFDEAPGTIIGPIPISGGHAVYRIVEQLDADMLGFDETKDKLLEQQLGDRQNQEFEMYKSLTRRRYDVEGLIIRHQDRITAYLRQITADAASRT